MGYNAITGLNTAQDKSNSQCNSIKPYLDYSREPRKTYLL